MSLLEVKEVGYAKLETTKQGKPFVFEMRLMKLELTSEYQLQRRWYYRDWTELPNWRSPKDWNTKDQITFAMKVKQKRDIMGYQVIELKEEV